MGRKTLKRACSWGLGLARCLCMQPLFPGLGVLAMPRIPCVPGSSSTRLWWVRCFYAGHTGEGGHVAAIEEVWVSVLGLL